MTNETRTSETRLTAHCRLEQLRAIATAAGQMAEPAVGAEAAALVDLAITVDVDLMNLPGGGYGVALVAGTMDEFERRREDGVNITRMVKRRP